MGFTNRTPSYVSTGRGKAERRALEAVGVASWSLDRTVTVLAVVVAIQTILLYSGLPFAYMARELTTMLANMVSTDILVAAPQYGQMMMVAIVVVPVAVLALVSAKWQLDRRY